MPQKTEESAPEKLEQIDTKVRKYQQHIYLDRKREKQIWASFLLTTGFIYVATAGILHFFILDTNSYVGIGKVVLLWTVPLVL